MTREMISISKETNIAKYLAPEKRTQGGTAVRNLSSGHVPKLLRKKTIATKLQERVFQKGSTNADL